ncbi:MAG: AAA family ATPase [Tidjanibacter sp.]|nr:AAA family ATPase [Tidjanibacter sp.]
MINDHIKSQIYSKFSFTPTKGQNKIIENLANWISEPEYDSVFILNGYAGTGKTTLISAFATTLAELRIKPILLAPTGRAAKVVAQMTGMPAHTIHKKIYRQKSLADAEARFMLNFNKEKDAVFIVDEASMIADYSMDGSVFGSGSLLDDLFEYVRSGERCRVMFVGDAAQLPPVGHDLSPALNPERMKVYGPVIYETLDEVVRQQMDSGILFNATMVRCMLDAGIYEIPLFDTSFPDFEAISGAEVLEKVEECYSRYGRDDVIVITRSNKRANRFNEGIRRLTLCAEEAIESGDMLMVVKNNYHFTEREEDCKIDFVANGDTARLMRIRRYHDLYGFRFADAVLRFADYDDYELDCKILLDTLTSEAPALTAEQSKSLFTAIEEDYSDVTNKRERYKKIRDDAYYNAMQVKFAYAVTCHKAQGGQWSAVFVDKMLFGDEEMSRDMLRWLYTAITRATEKLYLVNFDDRFFADNPVDED